MTVPSPTSVDLLTAANSGDPGAQLLVCALIFCIGPMLAIVFMVVSGIIDNVLVDLDNRKYKKKLPWLFPK